MGNAKSLERPGPGNLEMEHPAEADTAEAGDVTGCGDAALPVSTTVSSAAKGGCGVTDSVSETPVDITSLWLDLLENEEEESREETVDRDEVNLMNNLTLNNDPSSYKTPVKKPPDTNTRGAKTPLNVDNLTFFDIVNLDSIPMEEDSQDTYDDDDDEPGELPSRRLPPPGKGSKSPFVVSTITGKKTRKFSSCGMTTNVTFAGDPEIFDKDLARLEKKLEEFQWNTVNIQDHIPKDEYARMGKHEKWRLRSQKHDYIVFNRSGLFEFSLPTFMRPKRTPQDYPESSDDEDSDGDEEWRPDGLSAWQVKEAKRQIKDRSVGKKIIEEQKKISAIKKKKKKVKVPKIKDLATDKEEEVVITMMVAKQQEAEFLGFDKAEIQATEKSVQATQNRLAHLETQMDSMNAKQIEEINSLADEVDVNRRYPRRAHKQTDYSEFDGGNEEELIVCEECDAEYYAECPIHPWMDELQTNSSAQFKNRARKTCPSFLKICRSSIEGAGLGVKTKKDLPKRVRFGPYEGEKKMTEKDVMDSVYCWEICMEGTFLHYVDGRDLSKSNWLRYVNCARCESEQNLMAVQSNKEIYYVTCREIPYGDELLVWYGDEFANSLGIWRDTHAYLQDVATFEDSSSSEEEEEDETESESRKDDVVSLDLSTDSSNSDFVKPRLPVKSYTPRAQKEKTYLPKEQVWLETSVKGGRTFYRCNVCGKGTHDKRNMTRHQLTHTGVKPFSCDVCGKGFTQQHSLTTHMRTHTGVKPFSCDVCGEAFSQASHLTGHMRIHTGERPHQCSVCGQRFACSSNMNAHRRNVHKLS